MTRIIYLALIFVCLLASCAGDPSIRDVPGVLNALRLPLQQFTIRTDADTSLVLQGGTRLYIPKGAIKSKEQQVLLDIREALTPEQMLMAGLTTTSNGRSLSSGGMIYISPAAGVDASSVLPVSARVPAASLQPGMQLFKGEETPEGINWKDPEPIVIPPDSMLVAGKQLFEANCSTCHNTDRDATGPPLYGSLSRWGSNPVPARRDMYAFVRNAARLIADGHSYARCLFDAWNRTAMTAFPNLTDRELDAIFRYAEEEGRKKLGRDTIKYRGAGKAACEAKARKAMLLLEKIAELQADPQPFINIDYSGLQAPIAGAPDTANAIASTAASGGVPADEGVFYNIEIKAFGWHNIDAFLSETNGILNSSLTVTLKGTYGNNPHVLLLIPGRKVLVEGMPGSGGTFVFKEPDGTLPLPQGITGWVIAVGEDKAQRRLYLGRTTFTAKAAQQLTIDVSASDSSGLMKLFDGLDAPDLRVTVSSPDADERNGKLRRQLSREQLKQAYDQLRGEMIGQGCACYLPAETEEMESGIDGLTR